MQIVGEKHDMQGLLHCWHAKLESLDSNLLGIPMCIYRRFELYILLCKISIGLLKYIIGMEEYIVGMSS